MESFLDKCGAFNDTFFPPLPPVLPPVPDGWFKESLTDISENFDPIELCDISRALTSCLASAPGVDQIPYSILRHTHTAHPVPLTLPL
jgi:hypothetical protein